MTPEFAQVFRSNDNFVPTQGTALAQKQNVTLAIKQALTGENPAETTRRFVTRASSNGVTASATDLWLTAADILGGTVAGNRSWWIGRMTLANGRFIECMIADDVGAADTESLRFVFASDFNPFSLAGIVQSATPANPTNAAENTTAADRAILENNPTLGAVTMHVRRGADGSVRIAITRDGDGFPPRWLMRIAPLRDTHTNDLFPVLFNHQGLGSGDGAYTIDSLWNGTTGGTAAACGFWTDGTVISMEVSLPKLGGSTVPLATGNPTTDNLRQQCDPVAVHVWSNAGATRGGYRGRIPDLALKLPGGIANNLLEANNGLNNADTVRWLTMGPWVEITPDGVQWAL